jgi:hypothetical protein
MHGALGSPRNDAGPTGLLRPVLSALAVLLVAVPAWAQQLPPAAPGSPEGLDLMVEEFQVTQERLGMIQDQAFESSVELQERQAAISEMVVEALFASHPQAESQMARLEELEMEAFQAQQQADMEALGALIEEAEALQLQLPTAQQQVLEQDEVREEIDRFEADMMAAMLQIDPEAEVLLARLQELGAILSAAFPPST